MGIYKQPSIYKSGISEEEIKKICAGSWIDVSDKFSVSIPSYGGAFSFLYNDVQKLCLVHVDIGWATPINEGDTIITYDYDNIKIGKQHATIIAGIERNDIQSLNKSVCLRIRPALGHMTIRNLYEIRSSYYGIATIDQIVPMEIKNL